MSVLTLKEEIILIAVCRLGGNAHGVAIWENVVELSGREIAYGTLYNSLEYLIRKDYVKSVKGDPTPERGGKRKTIYSITPDGKKALMNTRSLQEKLWKGMPDLRMVHPGETE